MNAMGNDLNEQNASQLPAGEEILNRRDLFKTGAVLLGSAALAIPPVIARGEPAKTIRTGKSSKCYALMPGLWGIAGANLTHAWDGNAYLLADGRDALLIDCGSVFGYEAMKANLKAIGYAPNAVQSVIATHCHWDHCSGFSKLTQESHARFHIHSADADAVKTGDYDLTATFLYGKDLAFPSFVPQVVLNGGERLQVGGIDIQVVSTPGHTPGSVCVIATINGKRILFAGDTLWGGCHHRIKSDLIAWRKSLDLLLSQKYDYLTWGHYEPLLFSRANERLEEACAQFDVYQNPWFRPFYMDLKF